MQPLREETAVFPFLVPIDWREIEDVLLRFAYNGTMSNSTNNKNACLRCGVETTTGKLKSGNQEPQIVIAGKPDGFLGVVPYTTSPVLARVCTGCGHIELVARNLRDVLSMDAGDDDAS